MATLKQFLKRCFGYSETEKSESFFYYTKESAIIKAIKEWLESHYGNVTADNWEVDEIDLFTIIHNLILELE